MADKEFKGPLGRLNNKCSCAGVESKLRNTDFTLPLYKTGIKLNMYKHMGGNPSVI